MSTWNFQGSSFVPTFGIDAPSFAPSNSSSASSSASSSPVSSSPPISQSTKDFPPLPGSSRANATARTRTTSPPISIGVQQQNYAKPQPPVARNAEMEAKYGLRGLIENQLSQTPEALLAYSVNLGPMFEQQQR